MMLLKCKTLLKFTLLLLTLAFTSSCSNEDTIKIGFSAGLTGTIADLGIAGRNGALLAVEEVNSRGGINGKKIELIIKDDAQDPKTAVQVDNELISEGVIAIIGHMTSAMSIAAVPNINKHRIVMISPTTSTNDLTDKNDFFFRVYPVSAGAARKLAEHAVSTHHYSKISVIYDLRNRAHSESWLTHFKNNYESLGGKIVNTISYTSRPDIDFKAITSKLSSEPFDALFIIANSIDTSMIAQQLSKTKKTYPILATEWSVAGDIIKYGGTSVDGLEFFHTYNEFSNAERYLNFVKNFERRFKQTPNFPAAFSYEAANVLFTALEKNPNPNELRQSIVKFSPFSGLQGEISFNSFGDINRSYFLMSIKDGKIRPSETLTVQ